MPQAHAPYTRPVANPDQLRCVGLVVCDNVYRDPITQRMFILGMFGQVGSNRFPFQYPALTFVMSLTNAKGEFEVSVSVEHVDGMEALARVAGRVTLFDSTEVADIPIRAERVAFLRPALFRLVVRTENRVLLERPFKVVQSNTPPPQMPPEQPDERPEEEDE